MIFITLGLLILIEIYIIIYLFDLLESSLENKKKVSKYNISLILKISEIVVIAIFIYFATQNILKSHFSNITIDYISLFIILLVVFFWIFINYINPILNIDYGFDTSNISYESNIKNNTKNNTVIKKRSKNNIFSKYLDKLNRHNNYSFNNLYPNNIDNNIDGIPRKMNNKLNNNTDYSAYNGYPPNHICYKCECLKKRPSGKDNNTNKYFCGKVLNGSVYGCDQKWGCRNCKKCPNCGQTDSNNNKECRDRYKGSGDISTIDKYDCEACKCLKDRETINGYKCGRQIGGVLWECNKSKCAKQCSKCNSGSDTNDVMYTKNNKEFNYINVQPDSNIENVIIDNIKNFDYDGFIENNLSAKEIEDL